MFDVNNSSSKAKTTNTRGKEPTSDKIHSMSQIKLSIYFISIFFALLIFGVIIYFLLRGWIVYYTVIRSEISLEMIFSLVTSVFVVFSSTAVFAYILTRDRTGVQDKDLIGIISESDWYPSLSRVQFLSWTLIIGIVFLWFFILKLWYAWPNLAEIDLNNLTLPDNLLILMGTTSLTMVASKKLSSFKYVKKVKPTDDLIPLGTMFQEDGRPSLTRYQIFLWTSIGVLVYLGLAITTVLNSYKTGINADSSILSKTIPDCPTVLLFLMGISQATYLGGKFAFKPPNVSITAIVPLEGKFNDMVTIYGVNFGSVHGEVLFNQTKAEVSTNDGWTDNKITVKIPVIPDIDNEGRCEVRVVIASDVTFPYQYIAKRKGD